jgi:hypothetical protein
MRVPQNGSECAIETRLVELRMELEKGQRHLESVDRQRQEVRDTLLRISGAIQVLEELLNQGPSAEQTGETSDTSELRQVAVG